MIDKFFLNNTAKDKAEDEKYLGACIMGMHAILGIGLLLSTDSIAIIQKYSKNKHNPILVAIKDIYATFNNKAHSLGRAGNTKSSAEREQATHLSASNFLTLYFSAMKVSPEQLDGFCDDVEAIVERYVQQREKQFDFFQWLCDKQQCSFDFARYASDKHDYTFRVGKNDSLVIYKGVEVVYNASIPISKIEANILFNLIKCPILGQNEL